MLLQAISEDGILRVFEALLHGGVSVSVNDYLLRSVSSGALLCTVLLVISGADLMRTDLNGKVARDLAMENSHEVILNYINRKMSLNSGAKKHSMSFKPLDSHAIVADNNTGSSGAPLIRVHSPQHDALVKKMVDSALNAAISDKDQKDSNF